MANTLDLGRVALDGADLNTLDYLSYDSVNEKIDTTKPIVETMTGYSHAGGNAAVTKDYAGVVKNGNKITFAIAGKINSSEIITADSLISTGSFTIPAAVGSKLYPSLQDRILGGYSPLVTNTNTATTTIMGIFFITKWSDTNITFYLAPMSNLTANTDYFFRQEVTFLLSDNLVSE